MSIDNAGMITIAGRTGPRLGYGTMRLTGPGIFGPPADRDEAVRVLRRAVELGVRFIDTSWYYGPFVANEILRDALSPYPDDLVIITKLGGARRDDASWYSALTPDELREGCEHDLRTLGVESVPVAHLRWMDDDKVMFDDALATMIDLREAGKIEQIGLSTVSVEQLDIAVKETEIATVSNAFSVLGRDDRPVVDRCEELGIAYLPYFPLAANPHGGSMLHTSKALGEISSRLGATPAQVGLAWLLATSPVMVPIPGTSQVAHLEENLAAADLTLSDQDLAALA